jgi:hypothetical protein
LALHNYHDTFRSQITNTEQQREFDNNWSLRQQAEQVVQQQAQVAPQQTVTDNRALLLLKCETQPLARSKNVVTQLQGNFDADVNGVVSVERPAGGEKGQGFNLKWLEENKLRSTLDALPAEKKEQLQERVDFSKQIADVEKPLSGKGEATRAANDLGRKVAEDAKAAQPARPATPEDGASPLDNRGLQRSAEIENQVQRYQMRLQQQAQTLNAPAHAAPVDDAEAKKITDQAPGNFGFWQQKGGMMGGGGALQGALPGGMMPGGGPGRQSGEGAGRPAAPALPMQVATAGLKSLDVQFPERGVEYLFVTPRGEIAIEARAIDSSRWQRLVPLGGLLIGLAVIGAGARFVRRKQS